ncbi:MAG TPA: UDP-3-O-(3-hydroxymyristoyl)glucosamine N-acyltransferase [Bacteroidales bacterium]|nr:UDP-3-O-(3-hydroxymyristoyl)glucosamine N-acyltransferase [Bacteroidales bacterium]
MKFTAQAIASFLKGEVVGNPDVEVSDIAKIEEGRPGTMAFLANPKYNKYLYETKASIVLVNKTLQIEGPVSATLIKVDDAYQCFAALLEMYQQAKPQKSGIESNCYISESATLGTDLYIGAFAYIDNNVKIGNNAKIYPQAFIGENVTIGENTVIYPGVKIYADCKIGANCVIHAGAVIGADGFGFAPNSENNYKKVPQIGNVVIEDYVEIGANTTIDRATMGSTIIRKGVKLDNLIQIAHNVEIGENTVFAAQTGVAGSTKVGKNCMFGGQVGLAGHITVADGVKLGAQSGVNASITKEDATMIGAPAFDFKEYMKCYVLFRNLPKLNAQLNQVERDIKEIKNKNQ